MEVWANVWKADHLDKADRIDALLHQLRNDTKSKGGSKHLKHLLNLITAETVRKAARAFKPATAIGVDAVTFRERAAAPHQALE